MNIIPLEYVVQWFHCYIMCNVLIDIEASVTRVSITFLRSILVIITFFLCYFCIVFLIKFNGKLAGNWGKYRNVRSIEYSKINESSRCIFTSRAVILQYVCCEQRSTLILIVI